MLKPFTVTRQINGEVRKLSVYAFSAADAARKADDYAADARRDAR